MKKNRFQELKDERLRNMMENVDTSKVEFAKVNPNAYKKDDLLKMKNVDLIDILKEKGDYDTESKTKRELVDMILSDD